MGTEALIETGQRLVALFRSLFCHPIGPASLREMTRPARIELASNLFRDSSEMPVFGGFERPVRSP